MKNWMKAGLLAGILIVSAAIGTAVCSVNKKHPEEDSRTDFVFIAPVKWNRIARGAMAAEEDFGVSVKYFTFPRMRKSRLKL